MEMAVAPRITAIITAPIIRWLSGFFDLTDSLSFLDDCDRIFYLFARYGFFFIPFFGNNLFRSGEDAAGIP